MSDGDDDPKDGCGGHSDPSVVTGPLFKNLGEIGKFISCHLQLPMPTRGL